MYCIEFRRILLEETLENQRIPENSPLGQHLRDCPSCGSLLARIHEVDTALRLLPLEQAPASVTRRILEQTSPPAPALRPFLPWTLWLPALSLVVGILWAYLALLWKHSPEVSGFVGPTLGTWLGQLELWLHSNQTILMAVGISVAAGILFTLIAIALGLYVGRERPAISH